jgi:hypothetical protein
MDKLIPFAKYSHFRFERMVETAEQGEWQVGHINKIIKFLSSEFPVYVRIEPKYWLDRDFARNVDSYKVFARFTVGPNDLGIPTGIIRTISKFTTD